MYFDGAGNAPHISLIGDSTLTGVRWYADYGALERFNFVFSAESCRRTIEQSCISREGYRSANVIAAMRTLDGELGEVLVVMSGYNDPVWTIDEAIAGVVDEARDQGVDHVVWLSLRTSDDVDYSDPQEQSSINTFREYNEQLFAAAAASDGYLQVADWATYSNGASAWFEADGVHLTARGVDAVTTFIAGTVERVLAGEDVSPAAAPWTVLVPGAEGEMVAAVQEALDRRRYRGPRRRRWRVWERHDGRRRRVPAAQRRPPGDRRRRHGDRPVARRVPRIPTPPTRRPRRRCRRRPSPPTTTVPVPAQAAAAGESAEPADSDGGGLPRWPLVAAAVVVVSSPQPWWAAGATSSPSARRGAGPASTRRRRHAAVSPTCDGAGELPAVTSPAGRIYDHQLEQPTAVEAVEAARAASNTTG